MLPVVVSTTVTLQFADFVCALQITLDTLKTLTPEDLTGIGFALGPRKQLQALIGKLNGVQPATSPSAAGGDMAAAASLVMTLARAAGTANSGGVAAAATAPHAASVPFPGYAPPPYVPMMTPGADPAAAAALASQLAAEREREDRRERADRLEREERRDREVGTGTGLLVLTTTAVCSPQQPEGGFALLCFAFIAFLR